MSKQIDVSIIVPIFNGERWIEQCFQSIINQSALEKNIKIEISIYNDASTDSTEELLLRWQEIFHEIKIECIIQKNLTKTPLGVGYAKNAAINKSKGEYLCFQDIDDVMLPDRIWKQYEAAKTRKDAIIGSRFYREPKGSTERYTKWANNLNQEQLNIQIYTSHGPTVIMPTWFTHRDIFDRIGGFSEDGKGTPEDLIFFYKHIDNGGKIFRIDDHSIIYTYHPLATTFSVSSELIWELRMKQLEKDFISKCNSFTIWSCGKQGRKFFKSLSDDKRKCVKAMCDVDVNKIGSFYEMFDPPTRKVLYKIPIIHFSEAKPPIVICVKMDLTDGDFERNLDSLNLVEGQDYILFS